ncbi:hypothetical protein D3C75_1300750 [compost metagenome]
MAQVVDALAARYGQEWRDLIEYAPDLEVEALAGSYPSFKTPIARAAGFCHDGNASAFVRNVLE